jgi:glucan 1,3-beta-glucosidase
MVDAAAEPALHPRRLLPSCTSLLGQCSSGDISQQELTSSISKYLVSAPIVPYYYTQLIGDARTPPTLVASSTFSGSVIDADLYLGQNLQWYTNQNNLYVVDHTSRVRLRADQLYSYRSVRNFVIDLTGGPASGATALHWQVSQSTSLMNIRVEMGEGSQHQGMFMEVGDMDSRSGREN